MNYANFPYIRFTIILLGEKDIDQSISIFDVCPTAKRLLKIFWMTTLDERQLKWCYIYRQREHEATLDIEPFSVYIDTEYLCIKETKIE